MLSVILFQWPNANSDGPMALVREAVLSLNWDWEAPFHVQTPDLNFDLREVDAGIYDHMVCQALRMKEWAKAAERRDA